MISIAVAAISPGNQTYSQVARLGESLFVSGQLGHIIGFRPA